MSDKSELQAGQQLRQMTTLPESGFAEGFFLLKGTFSPLSPHACSGELNQREVSMLVSLVRQLFLN